jgi:hypothetical protein
MTTADLAEQVSALMDAGLDEYAAARQLNLSVHRVWAIADELAGMRPHETMPAAFTLPRRPDSGQPALANRCGTEKGYQRHLRKLQEPDEACRQAHNEYGRMKAAEKRAAIAELFGPDEHLAEPAEPAEPAGNPGCAGCGEPAEGGCVCEPLPFEPEPVGPPVAVVAALVDDIGRTVGRVVGLDEHAAAGGWCECKCGDRFVASWWHDSQVPAIAAALAAWRQLHRGRGHGLAAT